MFICSLKFLDLWIPRPPHPFLGDLPLCSLDWGWKLSCPATTSTSTPELNGIGSPGNSLRGLYCSILQSCILYWTIHSEWRLLLGYNMVWLVWLKLGHSASMHGSTGQPIHDDMHYPRININNVSTRLVAWYSIVAKKILLIQFHAVWGGLYCGKFFQMFFSVFLIHCFF